MKTLISLRVIKRFKYQRKWCPPLVIFRPIQIWFLSRNLYQIGRFYILDDFIRVIGNISFFCQMFKVIRFSVLSFSLVVKGWVSHCRKYCKYAPGASFETDKYYITNMLGIHGFIGQIITIFTGIGMPSHFTDNVKSRDFLIFFL